MAMHRGCALLLMVLLGCEARGPFKSLGGDAWPGRLHQFQPDDLHNRVRRAVSPGLDDRENCGEVDTPPSTRVNTTQQLQKLRQQMLDNGALKAYIIPMDDQHQSEYTSKHDKRVDFISGFSGSAGTAVVTTTKAALWTDGRYHLQGEAELDCNWIFMKSGESGVPSISDWLKEQLAASDTVGADPQLLSYDKWKGFADGLEEATISMEEDTSNLVDTVWDEMGDRTDRPNNPLNVQEMAFAGESWEDKVERIRQVMAQDDVGVDVVVVTALDEVAWLLNMRGTDVPFNPVFFGYVIVEKNVVSLYLNNHIGHLTEAVRSHLNTHPDGICIGGSNCVRVKAYADFWPDLEGVAGSAEKVWVSPMSSYAIYTKLGLLESTREEKAHLNPSLIRTFKGRKNPTEVQVMRDCYTRDSAALIEFMTMLEKEVQDGQSWTEISAATRLQEIREAQDNNRGLSFETISAVGSNGAIIHYTPSEETDRQITTTEMYLLDSGGQYLDGTTDVTRTFHFGTPNDKEIEAYTRVLMGSIDLAMTVWPNGTFGRDVDAVARWPLWKVGWNYRHGTGHGIGAYLSVHEGPGRISLGYRKTAYEEPMYGEMFFSDEPGYYEAGEFGVRLETIVMTTKADTKYNFGDEDYLEFEDFTLVPFEPHLIDYNLLSPAQRHWLNEYNKRVLKEVGENVLQEGGKTAAYEWVKARTQPIPEDPSYTSGGGQDISVGLGVMLAVLTAFSL